MLLLYVRLFTNVINLCIPDHTEILFIVVIPDISTNYMKKISQSYVVIHFFQLFQIYFHQRSFMPHCSKICLSFMEFVISLIKFIFFIANI